MRTVALILVLASLFVAVWLWQQPAPPHLPTSDVYTGLSVARHLSRGDGLQNDTIYPLFTAYSWGKEIPQPLVHRPPGLALLLLPAWLLADGDPVRAEQLVRPSLVFWLGLTVLLGLWGLARQHCLRGGGAWMLLLYFNPLLALAVAWGWSEVPAGFLLLALWLIVRRHRPASMSRRTTIAFAILSALLATVRQDLLWVPLLWWVATNASARRTPLSAIAGRTALAAAVGAALLLPWWIHVTGVTGAPFTNPLTDAVQLDLSENWWDYPLLRGRTPFPLSENLRANVGPALHKVDIGTRYFVKTLGRWLPWLLWFVCGVGWLWQTWRRIRRGHWWPRAVGTIGLLAVTLGLMVLQYAFFSSEVRHLLPLVPLFAFEAILLGNRMLRRLPSSWLRASALAAAAGLTILVTPPGLGEDKGNVDSAIQMVSRVAARTADVTSLPPGPMFSDNAVLPWRTDRAYVWCPLEARVEAEIRAEVPAMRDAPVVKLTP